MDLIVQHALSAIHRHDPLEAAESSIRFRQLVVEAPGNDVLVSLMGQTAQRMTWLFYLTSSRDLVQACEEHRELVGVMASGDDVVPATPKRACPALHPPLLDPAGNEILVPGLTAL